MRRAINVRLALLATTMSVLAVAAMPANAASQGVMNLTGAGTEALTAGFTGAKAFTFHGDGMLVTTDTTINGGLTCDIAGDDEVGTYLEGAGSFSGSCSTNAGTTTISGTYTRTGGLVTETGSASGAFSGTFSGTCAFAPTVVFLAPTIAFVESCHFTVNV